MLIEKEIISPATHWYRDEATGLPRKLVVTPELTKYWHEQGNKMLSAGLTVPVPCEHDFDAHPMTPADKLKNNAGWVKEYRLKNDVLFGVVDVQDEEIAKKLPHTIRWTSPWISSFTDGQGKDWNNVISHLALTTRPRIIKQAPFGSIAAALSMASETKADQPQAKGYCLSKAGKLFVGKKSKRLRPRYPFAFSLWAGGIRLGEDDMPPMKKKKPAGVGADGVPGTTDDVDIEGDDDFALEGDGMDDMLDTPGPGNEGVPGGTMSPMADAGGDIKMEEILCDLLQALGVPMPDGETVGESDFKRHLYEAATTKIKELTGKALNPVPDRPNPQAQPGGPPGGNQPNPLIQQEQQPMYMSLDDINKLPDPMRGVALAMYNENVKLRGELEANGKVTASLRDAKLKEASAQRAARVSLLGRLSPRVKADLDTMLALPAMALSMGDGGTVLDPMATTLAVLEKGLADMPRLLTTDVSAFSVQPQPTDGEMLSDEASSELANGMARMMGCPPQQQKAG